jgi:hypothetical protein
MKHPSIRELFNYWDERRGARAAPERAEIEPSAIRSVLADTFILSFEPKIGHPFRVAGTRVCALFGRDIKGEAFLDLFSHDARNEMRDLIAILAQEPVGLVASASESRAAPRGDPALELLLLPLGYHGRTDARMLGALAPSEPAAWLGTRVMRDLVPGAYRFLGRTASPPGCPREFAGARIRHGFVVYEGGNADRPRLERERFIITRH